MKKIIQKIFSVTNDCSHKVVTILGLKIKSKLKNEGVKSLQCLPCEEEVSPKYNDRVKGTFLEVVGNYCDNDSGVLHYYSKTFSEYLQKPDFCEKLGKLLDGLDEEQKDYTLFLIYRIFGLNTILMQNSYQKNELADIAEYKIFKDSTIKTGTGVHICDNYQFHDSTHNVFEPYVLKYEFDLKNTQVEKYKNKDIIDVGACYGDSAMVLSKYTNKNVYAIEPVKENYEQLLKNLEINEFKNIIPVNIALGDDDSNICITENGSCSKIISDENQDKPTDANKCITLDEYAKENNLEVGIIKMDVEGFESKVLIGAKKTIQEQKPILLISIYHSVNDFFEIKPLIQSFGVDYTYRIYKTNPDAILEETMLICEVK